jgi:hypothetical protein
MKPLRSFPFSDELAKLRRPGKLPRLRFLPRREGRSQQGQFPIDQWLWAFLALALGDVALLIACEPCQFKITKCRCKAPSLKTGI